MIQYVVFMAVMSLATLLYYGLDKVKAKRNSSRVSERKLLLLAFIGGAVGALLGMLLFRHKTRHLKFVICVPLFAALQIAALIMLCVS